MSAIRNDQITLVALLQLGGAIDAVDTEDIAIEADKIAPGRFRWRKFPEHIDLGLVRNGLQDARKRGLTTGGALKGWTLTEEGRHEAESVDFDIGPDSSRERLTLQQKAWITRERSRLVKDQVFQRAVHDGVAALSEREILKLFRIDEYVPLDQRASRLKQFCIAFSGDPEVGPIVKAMERRVLA